MQLFYIEGLNGFVVNLKVQCLGIYSNGGNVLEKVSKNYIFLN